MKKIIASAIVLLFTMTAWQSNAQTLAKETKKEAKTEKKELRALKGKEVSYRAKDHFLTDFGKIADAKWKRGSQMDEVTFTKDGQKLTAYYDYESNLVGTTSDKTFDTLPRNAQKDIKKVYKDYNIGAVIMFDDNENNDTNMNLYGTQFDDKDNYFVEISKGGKQSVLQVNMEGQVMFFKQL